jgi:hypothetical protein
MVANVIKDLLQILRVGVHHQGFFVIKKLCAALGAHDDNKVVVRIHHPTSACDLVDVNVHYAEIQKRLTLIMQLAVHAVVHS